MILGTNITTGTAPTSVTCAATGLANGTIVQIAVDEYAGAGNPFVQDGSAAAGTNATGNSYSVSFTTGSTAGDLIWGVTFTGTSLTSYSVASPFNLEESLPTSYPGATADDGLSSGVAASTQQTASWTLNGGSGPWHIALLVGIEPAPAVPAVTLSPSSLSFGNMSLGFTSAALTETLTNTGNANLTISSVAISGTNSGDFTKTADTCSSQTVTPTNTCTVSVTFSPSATGSRSASLVFTDNASNSPQSVSLSGTGIAGAYSFSSIL